MNGYLDLSSAANPPGNGWPATTSQALLFRLAGRIRMRPKLFLLLSCLLVLSLAGLALTPGPVQAHALLIRSDPEAGAQLSEPPERIDTWFSEPLEPGVSKLRVLVGGGEQVDTGEVTFDPSDETKMSVGLKEVGPGFYLVTWETLSQVDGHFRFGSFEFTVLNPDGSVPSGPRPEATFDVTGAPTGVGEGAAVKIAGLIGAVLLVGGLASILLVVLPSAASADADTGRRVRRGSRSFLMYVILPVAVLLTIAGLAELWLQARQFGGLDEVSTVLDTKWGERWVFRHISLGVVFTGLVLHEALRDRSRSASSACLWMAFLGGLGYLLFVSLVSHANAVPAGSFWATMSDLVHLSTAALWIGGLAAVAALLLWSRRAIDSQERPVLLARSLRRFSLLAATSLVLLLATGLFSGLVQVSSWSALVDTAYGRSLTLKLVLLTPLLLVAGLNAFILRPRLVEKASADPEGVEPLRRMLARAVPVEAALAIAVVAVAGVLTQYTPARTEAAAAQVQMAAVVGAGEEVGSYDFPLTIGNWAWAAVGTLLVAAILAWVWSGYLRPALALFRRAGRFAAVGLAVVAALIALGEATGPAAGPAFDTAIALRYQATDGRLLLLEISPFEVGNNRFRATVMTEQEEMAGAESVTLRFSRLERDEPPADVPMSPGGGDTSYLADFPMNDTGWWAIQAVVDEAATANFYLRLDNPSRAPLEFAQPDFQSEGDAELVFRQALERYEGLQSLSWKEQLTSGLLDPTGIGAWVITNGQGEAPEKVSYRVFSPGYSDYQNVRAGSKSCFRDRGEAWECREGAGRESFDLDYLDPSTAFRLGRREMLDGEMTQVLLFNNPSQAGAWYAWWIGEDTGFLRRQAMVAPGHFMLTHFSHHNQPVTIQLPPEAGSPGG